MKERAEDRSRIMRSVKGRNTEPEMYVRRLAHRLGYRFRLHRADLPGKPDLVFPRLRKVIFVHGCFWHGHLCLRGARTPKTNVSYWVAKIEGNRRRDRANVRSLKRQGWTVMVLWECHLKPHDKLEKKLRTFLA